MARRIMRMSVVALCVALTLSACGGKDDDTSGQAPAGPQKITVAAKEANATTFSFAGAPESLKAGAVEITFRNLGKQPHEFVLLRTEDEAESKDFLRKIDSAPGSPIPASLTDGAGVGTIGPGASAVTTNLVKEGTWMYVCVLTDEKTKKSHIDLGMYGTLNVTGTSTAKLPSTAASINASEYTFKADGLKAGANAITFKNGGKEFHHVNLFPLLPGKKFADVQASFSEQAPPGPPPVDFTKASSTAVLAGGASQVVNFNLAAGKYAMICFISDRAGGPPHFTKGMMVELDVT